MAKSVTVVMDDEAADLLLGLAGSPSKQGEFLSALVRAAAEHRTVVTAADLEGLRLQVAGLASDLHAVKARLLTLETAAE